MSQQREYIKQNGGLLQGVSHDAICGESGLVTTLHGGDKRTCQ